MREMGAENGSILDTFRRLHMQQGQTECRHTRIRNTAPRRWHRGRSATAIEPPYSNSPLWFDRPKSTTLAAII
jgi:hypothetical protein